MDIKYLKSRFEIVKQTDSFTEHLNFINELLASNDPEIIEFHFELLRDTGNYFRD
jgi:hypothetical protein